MKTNIKSKLPELRSHIGDERTLIVPPKMARYKFKIIDEIRIHQSGLDSKILCLQKVEFQDGREEIRFGYFIIGKKPRMLGRWVWGQFATFMPIRDFKKLIKLSEKKGWI